MNVLSLVTNRYAPFYCQQSHTLENQGVSLTHVAPREQYRDYKKQQAITRTYGDYVSMLYETVGETFADYDVVHANNGKTAPAALTQVHRPVVISLWGSDLAGPYRWLTKRCARYCDEVIVMTDEMNRELDCDAHVIPHGVDLDQFKPSPQNESRREVGWSVDALHVLFPYDPARSVKNYPLAARVVEQARTKLSAPVELHVLHETEHVDVPTYMNASDVLLLTSRREGSPNTVKEAMACNIPVVSTDVGDVRKRLDGVSPGGVCRTEHELVETLVSVLSERERSNGRTAVKDLSLEHMAERILDVYEKAYTR